MGIVLDAGNIAANKTKLLTLGNFILEKEGKQANNFTFLAHNQFFYFIEGYLIYNVVLTFTMLCYNAVLLC